MSLAQHSPFETYLKFCRQCLQNLSIYNEPEKQHRPLPFSGHLPALNRVAPFGPELVVRELPALLRVELEVGEVEVDGVVDRALPELEPDRTVQIRSHVAA